MMGRRPSCGCGKVRAVVPVAFLFSLYARSFPWVIQRMPKVSLPRRGRRGYRDGNEKFYDFLKCALGLLSPPSVASPHSRTAQHGVIWLLRGKLVFETEKDDSDSNTTQPCMEISQWEFPLD